MVFQKLSGFFTWQKNQNMTSCRDPGLNRGPSDLQSDALPTELSRRCATFVKYFYFIKMYINICKYIDVCLYKFYTYYTSISLVCYYI
jgi:hypothetical protein